MKLMSIFLNFSINSLKGSLPDNPIFIKNHKFFSIQYGGVSWNVKFLVLIHGDRRH